MSPSSASFGYELVREAVLAIPFARVRDDLRLGELAGERLDRALVGGELEVHRGSSSRSRACDAERGRRRRLAVVASPDGVSSRRSRPGARSAHRTADARRPALAVANAVGDESRCGTPALRPRARTPRPPRRRSPRRRRVPSSPLVLLPEPSVVARLAQRHRHEQTAVSPRARAAARGAPRACDSASPRLRARRRCCPRRRARASRPRSTWRRTVLERKLADVRHDGLHPVDVARREIDADELDTCRSSPPRYAGSAKA